MKSTKQFAEEILEKHGLTLISEYTGAHKDVRFLCSNGHENVGAATNILQRGYKCKQCIENRPIISRIEWTDDRILELQDMLDRGMSTIEIANEMKVTESAIHNAVMKFDVVRSRATEIIPELLEVLRLQERELIGDIVAISANATVKCKNGHVITQSMSNVLHKGTGCPKCPKVVSSGEQELRDFIAEHYNGWSIYGDRELLSGKELDIVLPELGVAFEYNGTYWHSEVHVDKYYHYNKSDSVEEYGYQLVHISDYLWQTKKDIVKAKVLSILGKSKYIGARKCEVRDIPWALAKDFLENTHLQGAGAPTKHNYALYFNNNIVALATFRTPRFNKNRDMELVRFSSTGVSGGFSKLLKYAITKLNFKSLVSYANRDFSVGKVYERNGFTKVHITEPNYAYYNKLKRMSRYTARAIHGKEEANLHEIGWYKVYDSGNILYELLLS